MNTNNQKTVLDHGDSDQAGDGDDADKMTPAYFKIAVDKMKFTSNEVVQAAFLVICFKWQVNAAAARCGVKNESQVSRAVGDIRQKWKEIHESKEFVCELITLTPKQMAVVRELEETNVNPLLEQGRKSWEKYDLDSIETETDNPSS